MFVSGSNRHGQCGIGKDCEYITLPKLIEKILKPIKKVYCGYYHTFCVTSHNEIYVFGRNHRGQLGLGHIENVYEPTLLKYNFDSEIKQISCGTDHTIVLTHLGTVYSFGGNGVGQLGLGHKNRVTKPVRTDTPKQRKVKLIACGGNHSIIVTTDNEIYSFGNNKFGQLGLGDFQLRVHPEKINYPELRRKNVVFVECGFYFTIIITAERSSNQNKSSSGFILGEGHEIWACGENTYGELGLQMKKHMNVPCKVDYTSPFPIKSLGCGDDHTIFVNTQNEIWVWGRNKYGQCSLPTTREDILTPTLLDRQLFQNKEIIEVRCGGNFSVVRTSEPNGVYTFGANKYGQLCSGDKVFRNDPMKIRWKSHNNQIISMSNGFGHVIFVTSTQQRNFSCYKELKSDLLQLKTRSLSEVPFQAYIKVVDGTEDGQPKKYPVFLDLLLSRFPGLFQSGLPGEGEGGLTELSFRGCRPRQMDILLHFLYTDEIPSDVGENDVMEIIRFLVLCKSKGNKRLNFLLVEMVVKHVNVRNIVDCIKQFRGVVVTELLTRLKEHLFVTCRFLTEKKPRTPQTPQTPQQQQQQQQNEFKERDDDDDVEEEEDKEVLNIHELDKEELIEVVMNYHQYEPIQTDSYNIPVGTLLNDMKKLYRDKENGNVSIKFDPKGKHKAVVHKELLSVRCEHFKSMFRFNINIRAREGKMLGGRGGGDSSMNNTTSSEDDDVADESEEEGEEDDDDDNDDDQENNKRLSESQTTKGEEEERGEFVQLYLDFPIQAPDEVEHFSKICEDFVYFLYSGEIVVNRDNAVSLISLWNTLGMDCEHEVCIGGQEIIIKSLDVNNVFQIFEAFINRKENVFKELEKECVTVCIQHWKEINRKYGLQIKKMIPYEIYIKITQKVLEKFL